MLSYERTGRVARMARHTMEAYGVQRCRAESGFIRAVCERDELSATWVQGSPGIHFSTV